MLKQIIYECEDFMAVDKPAGVLSQKDKSGDEDLAEMLKKAESKAGRNFDFLAPVHRLDRNTSGLILLAKNPKAADVLSGYIRDGLLHRTYLAIAKGDPGEKGRYDEPLRKDSRNNQVYVDKNGEPAITEFRQLQKLGNSSLVEVRLLTGRSHQIRVHFAHHGHALFGDKKYAKKPFSEIFHRAALHSWRLEFPKESTYSALRLQAPIPEDFAQFLRKLGGKKV